MKEELRIDIVGLAGACSYALDCIEAELVKIKNKHGKRVAYISVCMAATIKNIYAKNSASGIYTQT